MAKKSKGDIRCAIKEVLPLTIDRQRLIDNGCDLGLEGSITAAQGLAMALISKALEGDMKAFSLLSSIQVEEPMEDTSCKITLKVVGDTE